MTRVEVAPVTGTACSGLSTWPQDTTWLQRGVVRYVFLSLSLSLQSEHSVSDSPGASAFYTERCETRAMITVHSCPVDSKSSHT